ncbi:hypothetical protein BDZ45DRAFT_675712 [Acephala macrosclerotiorum]|nr:hypothetical protein BDZ45DRAFT_675712 [Acephala macrosclerotiorum]
MSSLKCTICDAETSLICSTCKSASYCSTGCQKKDLPLHKLLCDKLEKFKATHPRPEPTFMSSYKLGILFPTKGKEPELIWVKRKLEWKGDMWKVGCDVLDRDRDDYAVWGQQISHDDESGTEIMWNMDGAEENACLTHLLDGCKGYRKPFPGYSLIPLATGLADAHIVVRWIKTDTGALMEYQDISLNDLRKALTYFCEEYNHIEVTKPNPFVLFEQPKWIGCVIISCRGDQESDLEENKYRQVAIKKNTYERAQNISSISKQLGFTLALAPFWIPVAFPWRAFDVAAINSDLFSNPEALNLRLGIEPSKTNASAWNKAMFYGGGKGERAARVTVCRLDQQDVTPQQVEVLARYCTDVLHKAMEDKDDDFDEDIKKAIVEKYICRDRFEAYFDQYKAKKLADGDASWVDAFPPKANTSAKDDAKEEDERLAKRRKVMRDIEARLGREKSK